LYYKLLYIFNIILALSLYPLGLIAQLNNLGQPFVKNFLKNEYGGGTQSWAIDYSEKGYLFVANNDGLLVYNGIDWNKYQTGNKTIVRSLNLSENENRIYVGAQSEFGYFEMSDNNFVYHDLITQIPKEHSEITDVWDMFDLNGEIFFRADNKIFRYDGKKVSVIDLKGPVTFLKVINDKLLFNVIGKGVYEVVEGKYKLLDQSLSPFEIVDAVAISKEEHLILTRENGIYKFNGNKYTKWETNAEHFITDNLLNSAHFFKNRNYVFVGTHLGGLAVFNLQGHLLYLFDIDSNLQNNTITNIISDGNDNIWITTYNGIDQILFTSSGNRIFPDNELKGTVYDVEYWQGYLYFATANGLYAIESKDYYNPRVKNKFKFIEGTEGECWGLDIIDGALLVAHNLGGFIFTSNRTIRNLGLEPGVWKYIKINESKILAGGYSGIGVLSNANGTWKFDYNLKDFHESSRVMVLDNHQTLWVTHPYKGVYQIKSDDDFITYSIDKIEKSEGISNLNNCYGHALEGNLIVSNDSSVYAYDYSKLQFIRDTNLDSLFRKTRLIRLLNEGNEYYYISNQTAGRLIKRNIGSVSSYSKLPLIPYEGSFVGGFENLKILPDKNLIACTEKGVLVSNLNSKQGELSVKVKKILAGDQLKTIYNSFQNTTPDVIRLPYNFNKIDIHYSSIFSKGVFGGLKYSYRLLGADDRWSEWSEETHKEFNFLTPNKYKFEVRGLANGQQISTISSVTFVIEPHFLMSTFAKLVYLIIFIIGLLLLLFLPRRKLLREKIKIDKKVKVLEAEKYNIELNAKNRELAYSTMHLLQKSEFINSIKNDISEVKNFLKDPIAKKELRKIISKLQEDQRLEEDWERFSTHFDKVHHDFFRRLKSDHPNLSSKDLKLCAYLRLNLSTKEIAPLLGISIRGVEISRYRLRKKLNLDKSTNLNEYMISY
jgi:ligand-binding sensor domain-containing protein/DNA-binding CsgD family transcriptional regulator